MSAGGLSHGELATQLLVQGCLAHVAGAVQGKAPVAPVVLTELERADIGLAQGGHTLFYPAPPTGVFVDMNGSMATVWFMEADSSRAMELVDAALKRTSYKIKQTKDASHPNEPKMRFRTYEADLGSNRLALIEAEYPERGAPPKKFVGRIIAQTRR